MQNEDLLTYALQNGMLDLGQVAKLKEMNERKKYLENHKYWYYDKKKMWMTFLIDDTGKRKQICRRDKEELEDIIYAYYKERETYRTVLQVVELWLDRRLELGQISIPTRERYLIDARRYFAGIGDRDIRSLTPDELTKHIEETVGRLNLTTKAFTNMKTIVRGSFRYAFKEKYLNFRVDDVLNDLEIPKNAFRKVFKEDEEEVFNEEETKKLLEYLVSHPENHKHFVLLLCLLTGMRVGEAASLKHTDINGNMIRVRRTNTRFRNDNGCNTYGVKNYAKTEAGMRTVFVPSDYSWILDCLKLLNPTSDYIFQDKFGKPYSDTIINERLKMVCEKLGIRKKSSHKLRKTWFSIMLDNHLDNNLITKVGGHTSIMTSERSYHRNRKTLDRMSETISNIREFQMDEDIQTLVQKNRSTIPKRR